MPTRSGGYFLGVEIIDQLIDGPSAAQSLYFDYRVSLFDLPGLLKTRLGSIPADIPYIKADAGRVERWCERLYHAGYKAGIVWAGNPEHKNDRSRSCS